MQGLYFTFKISLIYEIFEHNYVKKSQIYSLCFFPQHSLVSFYLCFRPIEILLLGGLQAIEELRHCFPRIHAIPRFYTSILEWIMIGNLKRNGCQGYWKYAQIKEVNLDGSVFVFLFLNIWFDFGENEKWTVLMIWPYTRPKILIKKKKHKIAHFLFFYFVAIETYLLFGISDDLIAFLLSPYVDFNIFLFPAK